MSKIYVEDRTPNDGVRVLVVKTSKKKAKNKRSRGTEPLERTFRRVVKSLNLESGLYLKRHKKSNSKKRDGWVKDFGINVFKANLKRRRTLKPPRILDPFFRS